ncbi:MAG: hypothetical protein LBG78_09655 [Azoarcus sp.]|jgi:hypothetical protein|nr:hypothetical protein [Azoarcus sp.]
MMPKLFVSLLLAVSLPAMAGDAEDGRLYLAASGAPVSIRLADSRLDGSQVLYVGSINRNGVMVDDWRPVSGTSLTLDFRGDELVFMLHDKLTNKTRLSGNLPHLLAGAEEGQSARVTYGDGVAQVVFEGTQSGGSDFVVGVSNVGNVLAASPSGSEPGTWAVLLGGLGMVSVVARRRFSGKQ